MSYELNFDEIVFKSGEFVNSSEFEENLEEEENSFERTDEHIIFSCSGIEMIAYYTLNVYGSSSYYSGDYDNEPYGETSIDDFEIELTSLYIDDYFVQLTKDVIDVIEKEIMLILKK